STFRHQGHQTLSHGELCCEPLDVQTALSGMINELPSAPGHRHQKDSENREVADPNCTADQSSITRSIRTMSHVASTTGPAKMTMAVASWKASSCFAIASRSPSPGE